jgi:cob(I)alamin adenosyltransferase
VVRRGLIALSPAAVPGNADAVCHRIQLKGVIVVHIDRVTTGGGDTGETSLGDGRRVRKDDPRIEAIGTVDEANAAIGLLRLMTCDAPEADAMLARIQNDLFDVGADLCVPGSGGDRLRVSATQAARLETEVAAMNASVPALTSFILPGGSAGAAYAHMARVAVRRAERKMVRLDALNPATLRYVNRLSDHLFVLARVLNDNGAGDVLWVPGATFAPGEVQE